MAEVAETFDRSWIENVIFQIVDLFEIKIQWDIETGIITGLFTLVGTLIGYYWDDSGEGTNALVGATVGGATGLGVASFVSLRKIWNEVKEKLSELYSIVYNILRKLFSVDIVGGFNRLTASIAGRRELAVVGVAIVDFVAKKLGKEITSNISAALMSKIVSGDLI